MNWKNYSYKLKGGIIGGMISVLQLPLYILGIIFGSAVGSETLTLAIITIGFLPTTIITSPFTGKIFAFQFSGEEGLALFVFYPISIVINIIIGIIIGWIIEKIKKDNC